MSSAGTDRAAATARHLEGSGSASPVTRCPTCAGDSPVETPLTSSFQLHSRSCLWGSQTVLKDQLGGSSG